MGKEFGRIIASIAINVGLNILIRMILYPGQDRIVRLRSYNHPTVNKDRV